MSNGRNKVHIFYFQFSKKLKSLYRLINQIYPEQKIEESGDLSLNTCRSILYTWMIYFTFSTSEIISAFRKPTVHKKILLEWLLIKDYYDGSIWSTDPLTCAAFKCIIGPRLFQTVGQKRPTIDHITWIITTFTSYYKTNLANASENDD